MKINMNTVGNYNPYQIKAAAANKNVNKAEFKVVAEQITTEEKDFFAKMYPDKKEAIDNHHFYARNGEMSGVAKGSLFDRRG